jgi:S-disulfanyl-L-cysteine oxidoreductase SoxD
MKGGAIAAVLLVTLLAGCEEPPPVHPPRQPPAGLLEDPAQQQAGRSLFLQHCAQCHGRPEEGRLATAGALSPTPADFTHPRHRATDPAYLFWRISEGNHLEPFRSRGSVMPAFGRSFSEEQIWQLVAYLRTRPVAQR